MTRDRVKAAQQSQPAAAGALTRVTVTAIGDQTVTVQLPGGGIATAPRISGNAYTVGGAAWALVQEPAIGPVFPVGNQTITTTDGTSAITVGNGAHIEDNRVGLARSGRLVVLNIVVNLQSGLQLGNWIINVPTGHRPQQETFFTAAMFYGGGWAGYAICSIDTSGDVKVLAGFGGNGNGAELFLSASWRAA